MAHNVKCVICGTRFDRDTIAFVQVGAKRYAHADCALRQAAGKNEELKLEIHDPNETITCRYCHKIFNRNKEPYIKLSESTYAHVECAELDNKREKTEAEKLDDYIMKLFDCEYVPPRAKQQIATFIKDYKFTYSGIRQTLVYYYEIRKNDIKLSRDGIGIVPFVYKEAFNYFYKLWLIEEQNKNISSYESKTIEITIPSPKRNLKKRKVFTFLDEDQEEN